MKLKFSLKLMLLIFFAAMHYFSELMASEEKEKDNVLAGMKYIAEQYNGRCDEFIEDPEKTLKESGQTNNIIDLLSNAKKVSKQVATEGQKQLIAQSVMATVFVHNGEKLLNRNELEEGHPLYRHFRVLELIENLSILLNKDLKTKNECKIIDDTILSNNWAMYKDLETYSSITESLFAQWFNEALSKHNAGFVKLAETRNRFTTPLKYRSDGKDESTPSTRLKTEKREAPYDNGAEIKVEIDGKELFFSYHRIVEDSSDTNYLGFGISRSEFEKKIQQIDPNDFEKLKEVYKIIMLELEDGEDYEVNSKTSILSSSITQTNIVEAFLNYHIGHGQLAMASTLLIDMPLCIWKHENEVCKMNGFYLNGHFHNDHYFIAEILEKVKKLDESLIHLYHTQDDFYDSLQVITTKKTGRSENSYLNNVNKGIILSWSNVNNIFSYITHRLGKPALVGGIAAAAILGYNNPGFRGLFPSLFKQLFWGSRK